MKPGARSPLLGAAVLRELLKRRIGDEPGGVGGDGLSALYEGVLRDLGLSDQDVEKYLAEHGAEVEQAIRGQGRRGS